MLFKFGLEEDDCLFVQLAFTEPSRFCRGRGKSERNDYVWSVNERERFSEKGKDTSFIPPERGAGC
jgi:hypothetical protein